MAELVKYEKHDKVKRWKSCEVVPNWYMELAKYEKTWQSYDM